MTLTSPTSTDVTKKEHRLESLRTDLAQAFKECGPRFMTPHPTFGDRVFVIADDSTALERDMCTKRGQVRRSVLKETLNEKALDELIRELREEGYHLKKCDKGGNDIDGRWISFRATYFPGHTK